MPIRKGADVSLQRILLSNVRLTEFQVRYPEQLLKYMEILKKYPDDDLGVLVLKPISDGHYELLDGHHRFLAYVMMGRDAALSLIVDEGHLDEPGTEDQSIEQGLRTVVAEALGVDERRASLSDLRTKVELRRSVAEHLLNVYRPEDHVLINDVARKNLKNNWPELARALTAFENEYI